MSLLRGLATARPHLLVVEEPGATAVRLAVEAHARRAGWPVSDTPSDADVLVLAGPAGVVAQYADRVWDQLPGPRARVRIEDPLRVPAELEHARQQLSDVAAQRADHRPTARPAPGPPGETATSAGTSADDEGGTTGPNERHDPGGQDAAGDTASHPHRRDETGDRGAISSGHEASDSDSDATYGGDTAGSPHHDPGHGRDTGTSRPGGGAAPEPHIGHGTGGDDTGGAGMAGMDMGGHDMAGMDMGDHDMAGMDMGGHDMAGMDMPAGLAMADRADDRDGLKLDVLHVPWGPVLPWWPAGLVVTTVLQGDVVQQVRVELLGDAAVTAAGWRHALAGLSPAQAAVAVRLDALVRLLGVAGWDGEQLTAQRLRDDVLDGTPLGDCALALRRLARRVGRSRTLARMSRGLGAGTADVVGSYRGWLDEVVAVLDGRPIAEPEQQADPAVTLRHALQGLELGSARLVVAALGLELSGAPDWAPAGV